MHRLPMPANTTPQTATLGPPLASARGSDADMTPHELRMAKAMPSMERGVKFRGSAAS